MNKDEQKVAARIECYVILAGIIIVNLALILFDIFGDHTL